MSNGSPNTAHQDSDPRVRKPSEVGVLPDTQEGRHEGPRTAHRAPRETDHARRKRRDAERTELIAVRGNVCWICGAPPKTRALHVDHDHATGHNRGLLCFRHNRLMLVRGVTVAELRAAADYLEAAAT